MDIKGTILADPVNRWIFSTYKNDSYLVGGYLRDLLRGHVSADKDFVIKGNVERVAKDAAGEFNGTLIPLKIDQTYRVALKNKVFLDFTRIAETIEKDVSERDFTVNAIAWSPDTGIIDRAGGVDDIKKQRIKAVKEENIIQDPLRILRAYRLSAQLGFTVERDTRSVLKRYAAHLNTASAERVTDEVYKLLNCNITHNYLMLCCLDNVLYEVTGLAPRILRRNLEFINQFEFNLNKIVSVKRDSQLKDRLFKQLHADISQSLSGSGLIKLSLLLYGARVNSDIALKMSNIIRTCLESLHSVFNPVNERITAGRLYDILKTTKGCEYEAVILISLIHNKSVDKYLNRADEYLEIKRAPALSGNEIMDLIKLSPGQKLGELKEEIQRRQFIGNIRNRAEARKWIIANLT